MGSKRCCPPEAARIEAARRQVLDLFHRWGYEFVVTPHIEYLESLLTGAGQDLDLRTFKVTDPASGRSWVSVPTLRRKWRGWMRTACAARDRAACAMPAACCMRSRARCPLRVVRSSWAPSCTAIRAPASDVEVISLMLEMLEMAEVPDAHGPRPCGIYRGLARAAAVRRSRAAVVRCLAAQGGGRGRGADCRPACRAARHVACAGRAMRRPRCAGAGSCPSGGGGRSRWR